MINGGDDLKTKLRTIISEITVDTALSYSAPAITAETSDTGSLYQAQFKYVPNKQWEGTLRKTKINKDGSFDSSSNNTWSANDMLPSSVLEKSGLLYQGQTIEQVITILQKTIFLKRLQNYMVSKLLPIITKVIPVMQIFQKIP